MKKRVRKGSNCEKILDHLKSGNTLTALECVDNLRILNLAQRVHELERMGYMIDREAVHDGESKYTRYSYSKDNEK